MTAAETYLAKADEWQELSKLTADPDLRETYIMLALAYRALGQRLAKPRFLSGDSEADKN
jgi:hypothetical protein